MAEVLPFRADPLVWAALVLVALVYRRSVVYASTYQRRLALVALVALAVVTTWPAGDVAASVSLSVATAQRLVIMLLVAPLTLLSVPTEVLARATRPHVVDRVVATVAQPGVALSAVTVVDWGRTRHSHGVSSSLWCSSSVSYSGFRRST